jgi:transposase
MMRSATELSDIFLCLEPVDFRLGINGLAAMVKAELEQERFHWLRNSGIKAETITGQQLNWLLDGYDIAKMKPHKILRYSNIS